MWASADELLAELAPRRSRRWALKALATVVAVPWALAQPADVADPAGTGGGANRAGRGLDAARPVDAGSARHADDRQSPRWLSADEARFVNACARHLLGPRPAHARVDVAANLETLLQHADPGNRALILGFLRSARRLAPLYGGELFCTAARESRLPALRTLAVAVSSVCHLCFWGDPRALATLHEAGTSTTHGRPGSEQSTTHGPGNAKAPAARAPAPNASQRRTA